MKHKLGCTCDKCVEEFIQETRKEGIKLQQAEDTERLKEDSK